jgi:hypothetical protein
MFAVSRRRGFTLRDLFMTILVISIGLALLAAVLPRMRARGPSMRNACLNNIRQLGLALHNYHEVHKRFPVIAGECDNLFEQQIGYGSGPSSDCTMAQSSWIVRILPYIEESALYNEISSDSDRFQVAAFDPSLRVNSNSDRRNLHFSQVGMHVLMCPAFRGEPFSDNLAPADRYIQVGSKTDRVTGKPVGVAVTNYVASAATHKELLTSPGDALHPPMPNGVIVPSRATKLADLIDGPANTIMLTETKESSNSSWYDSSGTWVVALLPRHDLPANADGAGAIIAEKTGLETALNVGPTKQNHDGYGRGLPSNVSRRWGPSSDHDGGNTVVHCFADCSVRVISSDIDPYVYAALVTRAGGEQVTPGDASP